MRKKVQGHATQGGKGLKRLHLHFGMDSEMKSACSPNPKDVRSTCFAGTKAKGSCRIWNLGRLGRPGHVLLRVPISQREDGDLMLGERERNRAAAGSGEIREHNERAHCWTSRPSIRSALSQGPLGSSPPWLCSTCGREVGND